MNNLKLLTLICAPGRNKKTLSKNSSVFLKKLTLGCLEFSHKKHSEFSLDSISVKSIFTGATLMLPKYIWFIGHRGSDYLKSSTKAEVEKQL